MEREADEILWEGREEERGITCGKFVAVVVLLQCNQCYVGPTELQKDGFLNLRKL